MNEERKQGKNKGKNKQTDERQKPTMNEHQNKCISDMRTQYNTLTL